MRRPRSGSGTMSNGGKRMIAALVVTRGSVPAVQST